MAKTLTNLRTKTRTFLDEVSEADFKDYEVDTAINDAYHKVITAIVTVYQDYYSDTYEIDSVANQQEYSLPSDFFKVRRVEVNFQPSDTNSTSLRCFNINIDVVRRNLSNPNVGNYSITNANYYLLGDKIGFIPIPTESGTDAIKLWYIKYISDLSSASDVINIPYADRYWQIIPKIAAGSLLRKGQQDEKSALTYLSEANSEMETMKEEIVERPAEDSKVIADVMGDINDFATII